MNANSSHQITNLIFTPIAVGDPPLLNAAGLHAPYALRIIIELETRGGITGISEIPGNVRTLEALERAKPLLMGQDVQQLNALRIHLENNLTESADDLRGHAPWDQRTLVHIFSAVEVACLDIMGKMQDCPVADLLGGRVRDRVPYAAYLFYKYEGAGGELGFGTDPNATGWAKARQASAVNPEEIVAQAEAMCEAFGYQSIKLKGGAFPPAEEVAAMKALRKAFGPDMPLRLDPNAIWSMETAIHWGKQLEGILEYFEDPVRGQEKMAALRKEVKIPLATNMCTTSFADLPESIQLHSEDIILSDHHFWGGMRACLALNQICDNFGRGFSMHSNSHLGISLAAMTHIGAAIPNFVYALDTHYPWQEDEVIQGGKIPIVDGCVEVPKGPGLGVEIDRHELKRLHQQYLDCGLTERNDEIEMQKVHPGWKFELTRY